MYQPMKSITAEQVIGIIHEVKEKVAAIGGRAIIEIVVSVNLDGIRITNGVLCHGYVAGNGALGTWIIDEDSGLMP